jgi:membrane-bound lytic murein transglycosylase D
MLPRETRGYVPAFIAATYIMNYYCEHGIVPLEANLPMESDTVLVQREVTFAQIASKCNVTVDELRSINPQYRKDIIPIDYVLRLPAGAIEDFLVNEDSIYGGRAGLSTSSTRRAITDDVETVQAQNATSSYSGTNASSNRYSRSSRSSRSTKSSRSRKQTRSVSVSVKSGDTLSSIAKRNGTTVEKLRKMNGIKGSIIKPGQKVRVK